MIDAADATRKSCHHHHQRQHHHSKQGRSSNCQKPVLRTLALLKLAAAAAPTGVAWDT
jgi:hypothetical protein